MSVLALAGQAQHDRHFEPAIAPAGGGSNIMVMRLAWTWIRETIERTNLRISSALNSSQAASQRSRPAINRF